MQRVRRLSLALLAAAALPAWAQDYPSKPVRVLIGFPPGQATDVLGRAVAQKLSETWGQQFNVDNKPGASGTIATQQALQAPPDGYTLLVSSSSGVLAVNPHLFTKLTYDPVKDLVPVAGVAVVPLVLVANPSFPAKQREGPGGRRQGPAGRHQLRVQRHRHHQPPGDGHVPVGRRHRHDARALQGRPAGADRPDGRPGAGDVRDLGGRAALREAGPAEGAGGQQRRTCGRRPRGAHRGRTGLCRFFRRALDHASWRPTGTPAAHRRPSCNTEINRILQTPAMREQFAAQGVQPMVMTPAQLGGFIKSEITKWGKAVKDSGAKAE
jgi:hypothetical protein